MKSKLVLISTLFVFTIFSSCVPAQVPNDIGDWYGTVTINGSSSTDGAVVEAFINGVLVATDNVGTPDSGYYLIHVPGSAGNVVTFKVYGVEIFEGAQNWSSSLEHELNLTMNKTTNNANCTYNDGCISNNCASDYDGAGKWCAPANYCVHDNVTYADSSTLCSASTTKQTCVNGNWSSAICAYGCSGSVCSSAPITIISPGGGAAITTTTMPTTISTTTITIPAAITTTTVPPETVCGNAVCEPGENCSNCLIDCPCAYGEECIEGVCEPVTPQVPLGAELLLLIPVVIIAIYLFYKRKNLRESTRESSISDEIRELR